MSLHLLNPQLLGLLALIGVPILVHLVARARPPVYSFSSLRLLREVTQKTLRMQRPRDWFVLAMRTLAVLALVGAFLSPVLLGTTPLAGADERKSMVLVIDRSASMTCPDGVQTRFGKACARASEVLDSAGPAALANVVWIDAAPTGIFPEPSPNRSYLIESLSQATAKPQTGAIESALRLAYDQLRGTPGAKEVFILSDFQASAWKDIKFAPPEGMNVVTMPVAEKPISNLALASLRTQPAEPVAGQPTEVTTRVKNFSPEPRRAQVLVEAGDHRQTKNIEIPAWGEAELSLTITLQTTGLVPLRATLEEDSFPGDDARHAVVTVREAVRMTIVAEESQLAEVEPMLALGGAIPWLETRVRKWSEALNDDTDLLYVHAWNGEQIEALQKKAASGVALMIRPADGISMKVLRQLTGNSGAQVGDISLEAASDKGWRVALAAEEHPAFALFKNGEFGNPFAGNFQKRLRLNAEWPGGVIVASYNDGVPAIVSHGRITLWNLSAASEDSSWAGESAFVSFMGEWCRTALPDGSAAIKEIATGGHSQLPYQAELTTEDVELRDERNELLPVRALPDGSGWEGPEAVPGAFRWLAGGIVLDRVCSNFPETESDLRPLEASALQAPALLANDRSSLAAARDGRPIWHWLLLAAGIFMLVELLLMGMKKPSVAVGKEGGAA